MTTLQVANRLVELCRQGQIMEAGQELYAENIKSIEPENSQMPTVEGIAAVVEKGKHMASMIEAHHGGQISEPVVAGNYFSISWSMDVTMMGERKTLEEICVYKVEDGKITVEEFFY